MGSSAESQWLELISAILARPFSHLPEKEIADLLNRTFRGTASTLTITTDNGARVGEIFPAEESLGGYRAEVVQWRAEYGLRAHPVLTQYRAAGHTSVLQVADVSADLVDHAVVARWYDMARRWGCAHQLVLPLDGSVARPRTVTVARDMPFTSTEIAFAGRLRHALAGLDRLTEPAVPQERGLADLGLTPREQAVIRLLSDGLTARAIGRRLAITERTVHKHLQHAYDKLDARDRLSAVRRARAAGIVR